MYKQISLGMLAVATLANAQTIPRRATMNGGGNPNNGQCTVEVVVDGAAEVEIRGGGDAILRNLSGNPAQWRRFECNSIMPANPANFRFEGVDGRGKQQLVRDPRNGGPAVVRIEDPSGGSEGYTFRFMWNGGGGAYTQDRGPAGRDDRGFGQDRGPVGGRDDRGFDRDRDRGRDDRGRNVDAYPRERENRESRFFQRIREDLEQVAVTTPPFGRDQARLGRTKAELDELQQKLGRGFYDERELDDVTRALQEVVNSNRLSGRDRDLLARDLDRLHDFRERHEQYGAR
jgi:hypothetical protein